jgi:hypothetical protein
MALTYPWISAKQIWDKNAWAPRKSQACARTLTVLVTLTLIAVKSGLQLPDGEVRKIGSHLIPSPVRTKPCGVCMTSAMLPHAATSEDQGIAVWQEQEHLALMSFILDELPRFAMRFDGPYKKRSARRDVWGRREESWGAAWRALCH